MTADIKLLPLPNSGSGFYVDNVWHDAFSKRQMQACARANMEPLIAEIERLRAEVERLQEVVRPKREDECLTLDHWRMRAYDLEASWSRCSRACAGEQTKREQAEARAERLEEALQWYVDNDDTNDGQEGNEFWLAGRDRAKALLRDQEDNND